MKKLFILLIVAGAAFTASAQRGYQKDRGNNSVAQNNRYDKIGNAYNVRELNRQTQAINSKYDAKVYSIAHDRFMNQRKKDRKIKTVENQRLTELRKCQTQFSAKHDRYYADGRPQPGSRQPGKW